MYTNLISSQLWNRDLVDGEPVSHYDLPSFPAELRNILSPIKVNGHFECAIPTDNHGVFLFSLPDRRHATSLDISCRHVYADHLDCPFCSLFGFRYSLAFRTPLSTPSWTFITYGDSVNPQSFILSTSSDDEIVSDHDDTSYGTNQVIADQYSHRIVASNLKAFFFIDLTPSFPQPRSNS